MKRDKRVEERETDVKGSLDSNKKIRAIQEYLLQKFLRIPLKCQMLFKAYTLNIIVLVKTWTF